MFASFAFSSLAVANDNLLESGKPIVRELSGGQDHSYRIALAKDQYASVMVEQRGIDVVVRLLGVDGT